MSTNKRSYTDEFKQEAIKLAMDSLSVTGTAKSLGMPDATLHKWVRTARNSGEQSVKLFDGTVNNINVTDVLNENKLLKKKLARLEQEKTILKKAAKYFAQELG